MFIVVEIGFDPNEYLVSEGSGSVILIVRLVSGILQQEILVEFETAPGNVTSAGSLKKVEKRTSGLTKCMF